MKTFKDFKSAFEWINKSVDNGREKAIPIIAEQIYKDSNDFAYRESGDMHQSGELNSQFEQGVVIERTPYVRRRYYEGGTPGAGNRQAQPRWFDKTFFKYKKDYQTMLSKSIIEEIKKG